MFALSRMRTQLAALAVMLQSGCFTTHYIAQQAVGQLHLLRIRRPVAEVLADPKTTPELRERLELAMAARQFGIDVLGLRGGAEFTRYVDTGGPVAYNLTAADRTALKVVRWRFPLVGRVPYLGFFERKDALAEAKRLEQAGYDIYLRAVSGYSTLGYFLSPIYAGMVSEPGREGEVRTVEVMLHEMAHSTAYIKSASELNESFATLVGNEGAAQFFRSRGDVSESQLVKKIADDEQQRSRTFSVWLEPAMREARAFYAQAHRESWSKEQILRLREEMFQRLSASYRAAFPSGPRYKRLADGPLNNALLMSFGVYHESSDMQQMLLDSVNGEIRAFVELYKQAQDRSDGAAWLEELAAAHRRTLPDPAH